MQPGLCLSQDLSCDIAPSLGTVVSIFKQGSMFPEENKGLRKPLKSFGKKLRIRFGIHYVTTERTSQACFRSLFTSGRHDGVWRSNFAQVPFRP